MPSFTRLLARLERYDTLPAEDALTAALEDVMGAPPPTTGDPARDQTLLAAHQAASQAGVALWDQWRQAPEGAAAWQGLVAWAEDRLSSWHSIKVNAVRSAWEADPTAQDLEAMRLRVLINLRQGLSEHPDMVADGHFLQALANGGHQFTWTQAVRELQSDGVQLPADMALLQRYCALATNALRFLVA